jgi:flagellar basal body rod protein FlgC
MTSLTSIAQSGLQTASLTEQVSANNVANALTAGFVPSRTDPQAQSGGGVTATIQPLAGPEIEANLGNTLVALSGTDLATEAVSQKLALFAFQANLAIVQAAERDNRALFNVRG